MLRTNEVDCVSSRQKSAKQEHKNDFRSGPDVPSAPNDAGKRRRRRETADENQRHRFRESQTGAGKF